MKLIPLHLPLKDSVSGKHINWMNWAVLPVIVLALILRLPGMSLSLWYDEISVTRAYLQNIFHLLDAWTWDTNLPVHYTLMFFWNKVFDDTEFWVRFPPLIFGLTSLPVAYAVAKKIFNQKVALLTCFLLAISPVHIWYSTEARPYAGMLFFLLLALFAFLRLKEPEQLSGKKRITWLSVYFASILLGTFSHFYMALPVLVFSGISLIQRDRFPSVFIILNGIVLFLLVCPLAFKYMFAGSIPVGSGYLRGFTILEAWLLFFNWFATGNTISAVPSTRSFWQDILNQPGTFLIQIFFFLVFLKGIIAILRESDRKRKFWGIAIVAFLLCIPIFLLAVNIIGLSSTYIERSAYVALPFFYMIVTQGVMSVKKKVLSMLLLSGLVLISAFSTFLFFRHSDACVVSVCKQDWRSAALYLTQETGIPREKTAVVGMLHPRSLAYYDSQFADLVRPYRLRRHLPPMLSLMQKTFGSDNPLAQGLAHEIEEADNRLKLGGMDKIALLDFTALTKLIKKRNVSYEIIYTLENPNRPQRSRPLEIWLNRNQNFQLKEKKMFYALNIYKFERR